MKAAVQDRLPEPRADRLARLVRGRLQRHRDVRPERAEARGRRRERAPGPRHDRARREHAAGRAGLGRDRQGRARRQRAARLLQGSEEERRGVRRASTASATRSPATSRRSRPTARFTLLGRGSVCINSGGEKIYPEEVESALKSHPAVFDCLVVGTAGRALGREGDRRRPAPRRRTPRPSTSSPPTAAPSSRATRSRRPSTSSPRSNASRAANPTTPGPSDRSKRGRGPKLTRGRW